MPINAENPTPQKGATSSETPMGLVPQSEEMREYAWKAANFTTIAFLTSTSIVAVQSPIKTMLLNLSINGTLLSGYTGGMLGVSRALYAGTTASLSGSAVRTAYITGAKNNSKPIEDGLVREEGIALEEGQNKTHSGAKIGSLMSMALGDILVTQIPESLSQMKKVPGLLPTDFKWNTPHNAYKLMTGGFTPRYCHGMVNFASLCLLENKIAQELPFQDERLAHFTAGAASGMAAAFFAYPFAAFKDHVLVQSHVQDGRLYNKSPFSAAKELFHTFNNSPLESLKSIGKTSIKQVPIRMGLTGLTFALVAGVGEALGNEPLKKVVPEKYQPSVGNSPHGLFTQSKNSPSLVTCESVNEQKQEPGGLNQPK